MTKRGDASLAESGWATAANPGDRMPLVGALKGPEMTSAAGTSLDLDRLLSDCTAALDDREPERAIREIITRVTSRPETLPHALGGLERAGIQRLHVSDELTVLNVIWGPRMTLLPHNHGMWAVIGVYAGREDSIFWRRRINDGRGEVEAAGARSLGPGEVQPLGRDVIHSVTNPTSSLTGAIHVYGGDFFRTARSEWDPEALLERPYDLERNLRLFEESNAIWATRA